MSKERELIKDMKILLECTDMGGLQRQADVLIGRAIELLAQPEPEGVYQKLLRIEDGIEIEILPSELWQDGYETGRKDSQKREPLSYDQIVAIIQTNMSNGLFALARAIEKAHGIGVDDEH